MSNDLRNISAANVEILLNTEIIQVNQDSLGRQGSRISNSNGLQVWSRDLVGGNVAVVLFNSNSPSSSSNSTTPISFTMSSVGLTGISVLIRDLYLHQDLGIFSNSYSASVGPESCIMLLLIPSPAT